MQQNKGVKQIGVLKEVASNIEKLTDSLADVVGRFKLRSYFAPFDGLKSKGFSISSLLACMVIMPFEGVASVYAMMKHGITGRDLQSKKDAFYTAKNNENIDWRYLLMQVAKRFTQLVVKDIDTSKRRITALIFDDSLLEKTGNRIEKISVTYDHVSKRFLLGFKLLVCGWWDGSSFIPLDFSLHREKGKKQEELGNQYLKAVKLAKATRESVARLNKVLIQKQDKLSVAKQLYANIPNKNNQKRLDQAWEACTKAGDKLQTYEKQLALDSKARLEARSELKRFYTSGRLFGLTAKERKQQFKKLVSVHSSGFKRRKEADWSKSDSVFIMLRRAVKNGFVPRYVLTDSWFFSAALVSNVKAIKNGIIDLVSMVKINNQVFTLRKGKKEIGVKALLKINERKAVRCKKLKSHYIRIECEYKGAMLNLFFVKMGRSSNWHLLATTDLSLNFISLMEVYQIRWSIEVFYKECKQYLNLGQCKSSNFDAQIADTTISLIQHTMLTYCKRINYQTSFGELFNDLYEERMEHNLLSKLLELFWELIEIFSASAGFDFITIQQDMMQNQEMLTRFSKLIPERVLNKAA